MKALVTALGKKIVALEEKRLKAGKYAGEEKTVEEILVLARKVLGEKDE